MKLRWVILALFILGPISKLFAVSFTEATVGEVTAGENFLALTLKNSAQNEAKERIIKWVGQGDSSLKQLTASKFDRDVKIRDQKIISVLRYANAVLSLGYLAESYFQFDASAGFYKRALEILNHVPRVHVAYAYSDTLERIFRVYHDAGVHFEQLGMEQKSMESFQKAYEVFETGGLIEGIFSSELILGDRYANLIRHLRKQAVPYCKILFVR